MRQYELALVLQGDLSESAKKKALDSIKSFVKDLKVTGEKEIGKKQLAYKIKQSKEGVYFTFTLEGETIPADLERRIFNQEGVLRHLLLRTK